MRRLDPSAPLDEQQAAVAETGIKAMIPIGRPFLDYVLSAVADAGYRHVCLIIGPEQQAIQEYYGGKAEVKRLKICFAFQPEPRGTADAVAAAQQFVNDEPFAVINSDNYYRPEALQGLREQKGYAVALFEREALFWAGNITAERIKRFAVAKINAGHLEKILEKPDDATLAAMPQPLWVSMNCWRFEPTIFQACKAIRPSPRGELELTDAVQYAIDELGARIQALCYRLPVLDLTSRADIASVATHLAGIDVQL